MALGHLGTQPLGNLGDSKYSDNWALEALYLADSTWINEGSGWVIESIDAEYENIFVYSLLSGSTYIALPNKLKKTMKGLINIKNNDNKCFLWCHIRHSNSLKIHPEKIIKADKNMANDLDYESIGFLVSGKDFGKIEKRNKICINVLLWK